MNRLWKFDDHRILFRRTQNLHFCVYDVESGRNRKKNKKVRWFKMNHCLKSNASYKNCFLIRIALLTLYFSNAINSNPTYVWLRRHGDHRILSKWIVYENSTPTEYIFDRRRILISVIYSVSKRNHQHRKREFKKPSVWYIQPYG